MRAFFALVAGGAMLLSSTASAAELARTPSPVTDQEQIAGNPWVPWFVALLALAAIIFVVTDDDEPESP